MEGNDLWCHHIWGNTLFLILYNSFFSWRLSQLSPTTSPLPHLPRTSSSFWGPNNSLVFQIFHVLCLMGKWYGEKKTMATCLSQDITSIQQMMWLRGPLTMLHFCNWFNFVFLPNPSPSLSMWLRGLLTMWRFRGWFILLSCQTLLLPFPQPFFRWVDPIFCPHLISPP